MFGKNKSAPKMCYFTHKLDGNQYSSARKVHLLLLWPIFNRVSADLEKPAKLQAELTWVASGSYWLILKSKLMKCHSYVSTCMLWSPLLLFSFSQFIIVATPPVSTRLLQRSEHTSSTNLSHRQLLTLLTRLNSQTFWLIFGSFVSFLLFSVFF